MKKKRSTGDKSKALKKKVKQSTYDDDDYDDDKPKIGAPKTPPKSTSVLWICFLIGEQQNPTINAMDTFKLMKNKEISKIHDNIKRDLVVGDKCEWAVYLEYLLRSMGEGGKKTWKIKGKDKIDDTEGFGDDDDDKMDIVGVVGGENRKLQRTDDVNNRKLIIYSPNPKMAAFDIFSVDDVNALISIASGMIIGTISERPVYFNELVRFTEMICELYPAPNSISCFPKALNRWDELKTKYKIGLDRPRVRTVYLRLLQLEMLFRFETSGPRFIDVSNFQTKVVFNYEYNCLYEYYGFKNQNNSGEFVKIFVYKHNLKSSLSDGNISNYLKELKDKEAICNDRKAIQVSSSYKTREFFKETMVDSERNILELFAMEEELDWDNRMSWLMKRDEDVTSKIYL